MLIQKQLKTLFIFLLPVFCFAQKEYEKTDLEKFDLFGKVKSVKVDSYYGKEKKGKIVAGKKTKGEGAEHFFSRFDEKGNEIENETYHSNGKLYDKETKKYNSVGKLIEHIFNNGSEKEIFMYDDSSDLIIRRIYNDTNLTDTELYTYDNKGNKLKDESYYSDTLTRIETYKYNEEGKKVEQNVYFCKELIETRTTKYEDGNVEIVTDINVKYNHAKKAIFKFNGKHKIIEVANYGSTNNLERRIKMEYDVNGKMIEMAYLVNATTDSSYFKAIYKYSSDYLNCENTTILHGVKKKHIILYDTKKHEIEASYYNADSALETKITNQYEYDQNENWIKKTLTYEYYRTEEGKSLIEKKYYVTLREITYY
jgi:hypothetical protein